MEVDMQTRICQTCNIEKNVIEYNNKTNGFQSNCRECANKIAKQWYKENIGKKEVKIRLYDYNKRKKEELYRLVNKIKETLGCSFCGELDVHCLDFHHPNNDKDRDVSAIVCAKSKSWLMSEIRKCICLCANCHRKVHFQTIVFLNSNKLLSKTSQVVDEVFSETVRKSRIKTA
jgi:hypothetical protein